MISFNATGNCEVYTSIHECGAVGSSSTKVKRSVQKFSRVFWTHWLSSRPLEFYATVVSLTSCNVSKKLLTLLFFLLLLLLLLLLLSFFSLLFLLSDLCHWGDVMHKERKSFLVFLSFLTRVSFFLTSKVIVASRKLNLIEVVVVDR